MSTGSVRTTWILTGLFALAVAVACVWGWGSWSAALDASGPLTRFNVTLGPLAVRAPRVSVILSPDGQRIVFAGRGPGGVSQLYTRQLDQPVATVLPGTSSPDPEPFFSPDGEWVGFWSRDTRIKKIAVGGRFAITLGAIPKGLRLWGASWGDDNKIILGTLNGLWSIPAESGVATPLTEGGDAGMFPQVLPGAHAVVYNSAATPEAVADPENYDIEALLLETGRRKTLLHGGYFPRYLPTSSKNGHLVYMHEGTLFGVSFDPQRLELLGMPRPLLQDVAASAATPDAGGQFAFSNTGTFVYLSSRTQRGRTGGSLRATFLLNFFDEVRRRVPISK